LSHAVIAIKPGKLSSSAKSNAREAREMRDWMAFATAIVLALLTKMLLP